MACCLIGGDAAGSFSRQSGGESSGARGELSHLGSALEPRGALEMVHQLGRHAAADPPLSHELMGLAANVFAGCGEAKRAAVEEYDGNDGQKPACLAERMLRLG